MERKQEGRDVARKPLPDVCVQTRTSLDQCVLRHCLACHAGELIAVQRIVELGARCQQLMYRSAGARHINHERTEQFVRAQEPGLGISGPGDTGADAALRDVAAEPPLHRRHPQQAAGGAGGPEGGGGDCGSQCLRTAALVEVGRVAGRSDGGCEIWFPRQCGGIARIDIDRRDTMRKTAGP